MLCRKKIKLLLLSFSTTLVMWGAMSLFPHTGHAQIAGPATILDIKISGTGICDDGTDSGNLDFETSGKGSSTGEIAVIFGSGSDAGDIEGTMTIDWGSPPDGPGPIFYNFEGDSLAQDPKKGFFQLDAESAGDSDLLITGKYSLSKDGSQVKNASAVWQGEIDENGFDCFGSGKFKAKIRK